MNKIMQISLAIGIGLIALGPMAGTFAQGPSPGSGQAYPTKPVRIIFGFSPGGGGDVSGRLIAQKLSASLGQPVIVENRVGAGGSIASELVVRSPADGHTLLLAAGAFAAQPALRMKLPFDTERDFVPVSLFVITAFALSVHPSVPVRDVKALIVLARSRSGVLTFSSPGVGSSAHLAGELFNMMAQVKIRHIPFKGSPEAATAVAAGEIDVGLPSVTAALPLLDAGKLRAIAVTSARRSSLLASVPTLDESGLRGYDRGGWNGLFAPAGVPRAIVIQLNTLIAKIVNTPEMIESLRKLGFEARTDTPEQFAAFFRNEMAQNAKLVKFAGLKPN
jgi:tripartite-type tricarboxylate transporter receptor subunit TctC